MIDTIRSFRTAIAVVALVLGLGLTAAACDNGSEGPTTDRDAVRQAMLADLASRVILPTHDDFVRDADELASALEALASSPSASTLEAARVEWRTTAATWHRLSALNMPGVRFGLYHNRINTWPANVEVIEESIATTATIDSAYVAARGSNARGLPGLEYLLFAGDDALAALNADPQRRAYARFVAADVAYQGRVLQDRWVADGGDEIGMFVDADTEGRDLQSSVSRLVNEMAMLAEDLRYQKVGRPMGIARNPSEPGGDPQPDLVEAPYANTSIDLFRADLAGLRALMTGGGGTGLDDYLVTLEAELDGQPLGAALIGQIDRTDAAAASLTVPLRSAVTDQRGAAETLYEETGTLLRLIKTDLANWLGVSITFSDNDGDSR